MLIETGQRDSTIKDVLDNKGAGGGTFKVGLPTSLSND